MTPQFDSKMNPEKKERLYIARHVFFCLSLPNNFIYIIILSKRN